MAFFDVLNIHHWAQENPKLIRESGFQRRFSVNVEDGVLGDHLFGLHIFKRTLNGQIFTVSCFAQPIWFAWMSFTLLRDILSSTNRKMLLPFYQWSTWLADSQLPHVNRTCRKWKWPPRALNVHWSFLDGVSRSRKFISELWTPRKNVEVESQKMTQNTGKCYRM